MKRSQAWAASLLLLFGLVATFEARKLHIGQPSRPEPGFFPFFLALAFCIASAGLVTQSLRKTAREDQPEKQPEELVLGAQTAWTLLALTVYAFALELLGFLLATFLLMLFLFRLAQPRTWLAAAGNSAVTTVATYLLFRLLQVQLPSPSWVR